MNNLKLSLKQKLFAGILTVLSAISIWLSARPNVYIGYIVALVLIFISGMISDQKRGLISGLIGISAGLTLRHFFPQEVSEKFLEAYNQYQSFINTFFWLMILGSILIGFLGGSIALILNQDKNKPLTTPRLTLMAFFIALSVVINTVRVGSVSFGGFPIIFAGYILGPISGFIVGAVADIVAFIVRPSSFGFNPLFTLTSALTGLIPVIVTKLLGEERPHFTYFKVLVGIFVGQLITSVILAPLFQMILFQRGFWVIVTGAAIKQAISIPLYAFLFISINDITSKIFRLEHAENET